MTSLEFGVTMDVPQLSDVVISYQTEALTATVDDDYLEAMGEATITAGHLETGIAVDLLGDAIEEDAETFTLRISVSGNAVPAASEAVAILPTTFVLCPYTFRLSPNFLSY